MKLSFSLTKTSSLGNRRLDYLQAIVLGIVQGFTEFLPVSSSGHLVLFQKLLGIEVHSIEFDVAAHLGTLASVFTVYRRLIFRSIRESFSLPFKPMDEQRRLLRAVVFASIPTGFIGILFKNHFESLFSNILGVGICLSITGALLMLTRSKTSDQSEQDYLNFSSRDLQPLSIKIAVLVGFAQSLAIAPGISRSGMTIAAGVLLGLPQSLAAMLSFMISIPAILGAGVLQLKDIGQFHADMVFNLGVGFLVAYVSGLAGLKLVLHYVKKGRLHFFSYYLWLVSAATIFWAVLH